MSINVDIARNLTQQFVAKDNEIAVYAAILSKIEKRTDNGFLKIRLDDNTELTVPAFVVYDVYVALKAQKEADLAVIVTQFDGK